jgi:hypothetical protein
MHVSIFHLNSNIIPVADTEYAGTVHLVVVRCAQNKGTCWKVKAIPTIEKGKSKLHIPYNSLLGVCGLAQLFVICSITTTTCQLDVDWSNKL